MLEAPALRADMFGSPERKLVPGRSVMTPAKKETIMEKVAGKAAWDSDSDDDDGWPEGMSPPKTIHFHIPQSGILKTPRTWTLNVDYLLTTYSKRSEPKDCGRFALFGWRRSRRFGRVQPDDRQEDAIDRGGHLLMMRRSSKSSDPL